MFLMLIGDLSGYIFTFFLLCWKTFDAGKPTPEQVMWQYVETICGAVPVLVVLYSVLLFYFACRVRS